MINFASSTKRQKCLKNENQKASRTDHPMLENVKKRDFTELPIRTEETRKVWRVPAATLEIGL